MSIPILRNVGYTDDGCTEYECLNCYYRIETRNDPFYSEWKFCPKCGCAWQLYLPEEYEKTSIRYGKKHFLQQYEKDHIQRPLHICDFELWSRVKIDGDWLDWEKETSGTKHWVIGKKRELKECYEKDDNFYVDYEFKYKIIHLNK